MKLKSEWFAFASLAVNFLGMPKEAVPLYSPKSKWRRKAKMIVLLIIETGNFGHNRDISYYNKYSYLIRKIISLWRHTWDNMRQLLIFPIDSLLIWGKMIRVGIMGALAGI